MTATGTATDRRIVAHFFTSVDGVVESPDKWSFPYFDEEIGAAIDAGFEASDTLLMGAASYREWAEYWPTSDNRMAHIMNGRPKYVVSDQLTSADWANTTLLPRAGAADALRALKAAPGRDIALSGSATLVRWLLDEGLLDELNLLIMPVVAGTGAHLFPTGSPSRPLTLAHSATFGSGVLHLTYAPGAS